MVQQISADDSLARAISNLSVSEGPDGDREPGMSKFLHRIHLMMKLMSRQYTANHPQ
jgi:hypothetical protein